MNMVYFGKLLIETKVYYFNRKKVFNTLFADESTYASTFDLT